MGPCCHVHLMGGSLGNRRYECGLWVDSRPPTSHPGCGLPLLFLWMSPNSPATLDNHDPPGLSSPSVQ